MPDPAFQRPLPDFLRALLDGYEQVFRLYYGLDLEFPPDPEKKDPNQNRFINSLAKFLLRDASNLVAGGELHALVEHMSATFPARDLAKFLGEQDVIGPQVEIDLARQDLERLRQRRQRVIELLALLSDVQPSARVTEYLRHAAACFLACLDAETLVMCRAVLDAVFEESVPDAVVREHVPDRIRGSIVLANRIDAAEKAGWLTKDVSASARTIKNAGNDALHNVPVATLTSLEAMRGTVQVLERLVPRAA